MAVIEQTDGLDCAWCKDTTSFSFCFRYFTHRLTGRDDDGQITCLTKLFGLRLRRVSNLHPRYGALRALSLFVFHVLKAESCTDIAILKFVVDAI